MRMSNPTPKALATYGIELLEELTEVPTPSPSTCALQPCNALDPNNRFTRAGIDRAAACSGERHIPIHMREGSGDAQSGS